MTVGAGCQVAASSSWTNAAIVVTALGAFTFVVSYAWSTRGAWRNTVVGLQVMAFTAVILTVSCLAVAAIFLGSDWPGRDAIRFLAWSAIAGCLWWQVFLLYRAQRRSRGRGGS